MKKYDCSKTIDYVHEVSRMCEEYPICGENCPLVKLGCFRDGMTREESIAIVQKWCDENPEEPKSR